MKILLLLCLLLAGCALPRFRHERWPSPGDVAVWQADFQKSDRGYGCYVPNSFRRDACNQRHAEKL